MGGLVLAGLGAGVALAGPPPGGSVEWKPLKADCVYLPEEGRWVARHTGKYTAKTAAALDSGQPHKAHYMKFDIRIDKRALGGWRKMEARKTKSLYFNQRSLPYWIQRGVKTQVGPTIVYDGQLRGKLTVKMFKQRHGVPDKKLWTDNYVTSPFTCEFPG